MVLASIVSPENQTEEVDLFCNELPLGRSLWVAFAVPCACVAIPGSVGLLWVLIQRQRSGLANDIYICNLTVMDVVFNILIPPCAINYFFLQNVAGLMATKLVYSFNVNGRPLFTICMCVDVYLAVVHPIIYMKRRNSKHKAVICGLAWGLTLFYGIMLIVKLEMFMTIFAVIPYLLALPPILFCGISILRALKRPDPSGRTDIHPQKQRALQTVTNSLVLTLVSYLPPTVMYIISVVVFPGQQEILCKCSVPNLIFPMLGSTVQPLLHLGNLGALKKLAVLACPQCTLIQRVVDLLKEPEI